MTNRDYHAIIRHLRNKAADSGVSEQESKALTAKADELAKKYHVTEITSKLASNAAYGKPHWTSQPSEAGPVVYSDDYGYDVWLDSITEDPFLYTDPDWGETVDWWGN